MKQFVKKGHEIKRLEGICLGIYMGYHISQRVDMLLPVKKAFDEGKKIREKRLR